MKIRILIIAALFAALPMQAQKKEEKPKVHPDYLYGAYPLARDFLQTMADEKARLLVLAALEGWDNERVTKSYTKYTVKELNVVSDKLEDDRLIRRGEQDYQISPGMPVIRERDWLKIKDGLHRHVLEFTSMLQNNWAEIEAMATALQGSKSLPKERIMYETVVSGILMGGLMDAFYEDKTLMPPGPLRGKSGNTRYYAWMTEGNLPEAVGKLKRELRESDNYRIISIGPELPEERLNASDLRGKATVYEADDALKYRRFIAVFSRDKLLSYFKNHRQEFLSQGALVSAGRYAQTREVFAWYYNALISGTVDELIAAKRIAPPEKSYTYAVRIPQ